MTDFVPQIENEISSLLAGQFSAFDESELEAELEALVAQESTKPQPQQQREDLVLPETPQHTPVVLPDTPTHIPTETRSPTAA